MNSFATMRRATHQGVIAAGLALLMLVSRIHPIGAWLHLPNGSDAVFFAAGLLLASPWFLALFMLEAATIDTVTVLFGQSTWCITVAYSALVLAYTAIWTAGRWASQQQGSLPQIAARVGIGALAGYSVGFIISNGAFYWLSGRHPNPTFAEYLARFTHYYPTFVGTAWVFSMVVAGSYWALSRLNANRIAI